MKRDKSIILYVIIMGLFLFARVVSKWLLYNTLTFLDISFRYIIISIFEYVVCLIIPLIAYLVISKCNIKETLKLRRISLNSIICIIFVTILFYPFFSFLSEISTYILGYNAIDDVFNIIGSAPISLLIITVVFNPAIVEELIFRGAILANNKDKNEIKLALLNGLSFAIFHLNLQQSLYTFFMGFLFSLFVIYTKSIFASIIAHISVNGINLLIQVLLSRFSSNELSDAVAQQTDIKVDLISGIIIPNLIVFILTVCGFLLLRNLKKQNECIVNE